MNLETTDQPSNLICAERPFFNSRPKLAMVNRHLIITELHATEDGEKGQGIVMSSFSPSAAFALETSQELLTSL